MLNRKILVVDDLERARRALAHELTDAGFDVIEAADGVEAWEQFRTHRPDAVVTDMVMPESDGMDLLGRIRTQSDVPVIMFTSRGSIQSAAEAFKTGADDFIASDEITSEELVETITRAIDGHRRERAGDSLLGRIAGSSSSLSRIRDRIAGLAPLRHPVLVCGEAGSGRDTAVDCLHAFGASGQGSLIRVPFNEAEKKMSVPNCSAIYLDGIERFPERAQSFWTRYIEDCEARAFEGSPRILASSSDPASALSDGDQLDQLLRDRMLRYAIELPPLRSVRDDVGEIADALVARLCEKVGRQVKLSPAARDYLPQQPWPGNVRQLELMLERSVAFTRGRQIRRDTVHDVLTEGEETLDSIREQHIQLERDTLLHAIRDAGGNVSQAAEALGKSRGAIYRLIEKHDIPLRRRD